MAILWTILFIILLANIINFFQKANSKGGNTNYVSPTNNSTDIQSVSITIDEEGNSVYPNVEPIEDYTPIDTSAADSTILTEKQIKDQKKAKQMAEYHAYLEESKRKKQIKQMKKRNIDPATGMITCPRCGSTQVTANKKGFSAIKGVVGASVSLGVGAVAGSVGSKKVIITCMACGKQWQPKK